MTSFRKLNKNDDISLVARGIYSGDKKIFNALFKDEKEAIGIIEKLITAEYVNEYHGFFITVIYDENPDEIEGFVITYKTYQIPRNTALKAYGDTEEISIPLILLNSIIGKIRYEITRDDYIIKNLYVLEECRNKPHAVRLVKKSIQKARQNNARRVVVYVDGTNTALINFYKKLGFTQSSKKMLTLLGKMRGYYRLKYEFN